MQAPITVPIEALFKFNSKLLVIEGDQKGTNLNKTNSIFFLMLIVFFFTGIKYLLGY